MPAQPRTSVFEMERHYTRYSRRRFLRSERSRYGKAQSGKRARVHQHALRPDKVISSVENHGLAQVRALLVRVGADQSEGGGWWNAPVNSVTREFAYAP